MSIDITQQALNALADAGLGNDSPAEAYVIGYTQGHDDALALAIQLERSINRRPFTPARRNGSPCACTSRSATARLPTRAARPWTTASAWTLIDGTEETE